MAIDSKNKGKSGGARVISYVKVSITTVLLFSIYNKGDKDSISDKEIKELIILYSWFWKTEKPVDGVFKYVH